LKRKKNATINAFDTMKELSKWLEKSCGGLAKENSPFLETMEEECPHSVW
jgi:hypothetical protein